jgi:lipopolysaccharide biosynthesis glycosyltransferase
MDSDKIRATPGLQDQMQDMIAAQGYPTVDQDRINVIFEGQITHLDPAWNCSWGRLGQQRRFETGLPSAAAVPHPVILHFHGPKKPWQPLRLSSLKKGAISVWAYRRAMRDFARSFPEPTG